MPTRDRPAFASISNRLDVNLENLMYARKYKKTVTLYFVNGNELEVPLEEYLVAKHYYGIGDDWESEDESS